MAADEIATLSLYRAVSPLELADIRTVGRFRSVAGAMEGKWFAELLDDALAWGNQLYPKGDVFHVVRAFVPQDAADLMFRIPRLDQIGPARYADEEVLMMQDQTSWPIVVEI